MKIGIRGLGLIGGSFEKAFRRAGHETFDLKNAPAADIGACDFVFVCLPPLLVAPWIKEHADDFAAGAIVTDAAGVKGVVMDALRETAKSSRWTYIGGHPMAGREVSGYANSSADLFDGASMVLTPYEQTPPSETERLKSLLLEIGFAKCVKTTPERHDEMIAYTSQLAHVVSSAYVRDGLSKSHDGFSAGSFQDMTRVATLDPELWSDLFLSNRRQLDEVLSRLIDRLCGYRDAIRDGNAPKLKALLAEGRDVKGALPCR